MHAQSILMFCRVRPEGLLDHAVLLHQVPRRCVSPVCRQVLCTRTFTDFNCFSFFVACIRCNKTGPLSKPQGIPPHVVRSFPELLTLSCLCFTCGIENFPDFAKVRIWNCVGIEFVVQCTNGKMS